MPPCVRRSRTPDMRWRDAPIAAVDYAEATGRARELLDVNLVAGIHPTMTAGSTA